MLLSSGVDLHSYQPTADDIVMISDCDLFVCVGGESDGWVEGVLKNAANRKMKVINLLEVLGDSVKTEEIVEGMQEAEHAHDHSKEVSTFEDHEVQDRSLSDWEGSWQSAYPFALDGTLDDAFAAMSEEGEMTADEYKTYYQNGYKTDITNIDIEGDHIAFTYEDGKKVGSGYKYIGYYIQNWSTGTKAAMYHFEAVDRTSGAPVYIEFNDHMIESAAPEHFHIRMSNESFDAIVDPEKSWPTFFPADMTGEELCEHMEGHGHAHEEEADEHIWLSLKNAKTLVGAIANALQELDPDNKSAYAANAAAYIERLSALDGAYQSAVDGAARKTVLFGDRFPFRYLADDYGLRYYVTRALLVVCGLSLATLGFYRPDPRDIPRILKTFGLLAVGAHLINLLLCLTLCPEANYFFTYGAEISVLKLFWRIIPAPLLYGLPAPLILAGYMYAVCALSRLTRGVEEVSFS